MKARPEVAVTRGRVPGPYYRQVVPDVLLAKWREWMVENGIIDKADNVTRLIVDLNVAQNRAEIWVQKPADTRQLVSAPPSMKLE
jgi:hypothetical protein